MHVSQATDTDGQTYAQKGIVRNLSWTLSPHKLHGLMGRSGSGKTSLSLMFAGLLQPSRGHILLLGQDWTNHPTLRQKRVIYMPQTPVLFNGTLFDNIVYNIPGWTPRAVHRLLQRHAIANVFSSGVETESPKQKPGRASSQRHASFGEETYLHRDVGHLGQRLSGGQKQMVMLARTLVMIEARTKHAARTNTPWLLILDEPTASLDAKNERRLIAALHHLKARVTILVITHSEQVARLCDSHRILA